MSVITYQRERVPAIKVEAEPLLLAHWAEVSPFGDIHPDVDWSIYEMTDDLGFYRCYTARSEGELVGYAGFIVRRHPHYGTSLQATHDVLYLHPSARHGLAGLEFIRWCDEQLRAEGVQLVYQMVKLAHNHGLLLERLGYEPVEQTYVKRLDR